MTLLDWRDRDHWSAAQLPCRHCGGPTNLRTPTGQPAHKTCEEAEAP